MLVDNEKIPPPDFMAFVDSRDVAKAHMAAFENKDAGGERFILAQHFDYQSVADAMREELPEYANRFPEGTPGAGWEQLRNGEVYQVDGSKAERIDPWIEVHFSGREHERLVRRAVQG